jgi:hypothetical protein
MLIKPGCGINRFAAIINQTPLPPTPGAPPRPDEQSFRRNGKRRKTVTAATKKA